MTNYQLVMMKTEESKVSYKSNELSQILEKNFAESINLARIKLMALFICALCKVQTVCFEKLASAFDHSAKKDSSLRRIQRFMADYVLDMNLIAKLVFSLLPHEPPYTLTMDRTSWKFGTTDINALVLAVCYKGAAFPILFNLMPKRGNSNTTERKAIINRYIELFGRETIAFLVADREFVGEDWIKYLNEQRIEYHIRVRENFWAQNPKNGKRYKLSWLFQNLKLNQPKFLYQIFYINNQLCYLSGCKVMDKNGKPELQIIISFCKPETAYKIYKERWQIETAFKALKTSGFNIENTHLTELDRIEKLFALVIIAFTWAYLVGIFLHENIKPIRILNNGRKAKSLFRYGLDYIKNALLNTCFRDDINMYKFLSCT